MSVKLKGIPLQYANALRRICLNGVPVFAIDTVDIIENLKDANITSGRVDAYRALTDSSGDSKPRIRTSSNDSVDINQDADNNFSSDFDSQGCFINTAQNGTSTEFMLNSLISFCLGLIGFVGLKNGINQMSRAIEKEE